jgi:hypothetical protein
MEKDSELTGRRPLSMKWFGQEGMIPYDIYKGEKKYGYYRFHTPPGLERIECKAFGKINARINGRDLRIVRTGENPDMGSGIYTIYLDQVYPGESDLCLEVEHFPGYYEGRAFPEPLKLICGKGNMQTGDWSESDVLKCYSGGLWYRKNIELNKKEISNNIFLDLGTVVASAEVHINGKKVGTCLKKPFCLNIQDFVKEGDNYFEILVYSTLANHYYSIPTPRNYKSSFTTGLIGPVKIRYEK